MALQRDWKREREICAAYLKGKSHGEIGDAYGISRERTRQILKRNDITSDNSPRGETMEVQKLQKEKEIRRKRFLYQCEIIKSYDCRRLIIREMRQKLKNVNGDPFFAYRQQRYNAYYRGVGWELNFQQWWQIWEDSGKWSHRGRGIGKYVMGRFNDQGSYCKNNARIISHSENIIEGHERKMKRKIKSGVANEEQLR